MTPQTKNFYKLERRWKDAEVYDLTPVLAANSPNGNSGEYVSNDTSSENAAENDPFWS